MAAVGAAVIMLLVAVLRPGAEQQDVTGDRGGRPAPSTEDLDVVVPAPVTARCAAPGGVPACEVVEVAPRGAAAGGAVAVGRTLVLVDGTTLKAVDLDRGGVRWRNVAVGSGARGRLTAGHGTVLVAAPGLVLRLDPRDGSVVWRTAVGAESTVPRLWIFPDGILALDGRGRLLSLGVPDGTVRWELSGIQANVEPTPTGLLVRTGTELGLWRPNSEVPTWRRADTVGHALELPPGSIVGLLSNPGRIDMETGERLLITPGSTVLGGYLPPDLPRAELRWTEDGTELVVTATDLDGRQPRWQSPSLPLPCCSAIGVPAGDDRIALASGEGGGVILDVSTGGLIATLEEPGGTLLGVRDGLALWRTPEGLVGGRVADGTVVLRGTGEVVSLDPLVLDGPGGVVHVRWNDAEA